MVFVASGGLDLSACLILMAATMVAIYSFATWIMRILSSGCGRFMFKDGWRGRIPNTKYDGTRPLGPIESFIDLTASQSANLKSTDGISLLIFWKIFLNGAW